MQALGSLAWLGLFLWLVAWWLLQAKRLEHSWSQYVGPGPFIGLAALLLLINAVCIVGNGWFPLHEGLAAIEASPAGAPRRDGLEAPARARLFLNSVSLSVPRAADDEGLVLRVGYSSEADLRLPRLYDLPEARGNDDVFEIYLSTDDFLSLRIQPVHNEERPHSRVVWESVLKEHGDDLLPGVSSPGSAMARAVSRLFGERPCERRSRTEISGSTTFVHLVLVCSDEGSPRSLMVIDRITPQDEAAAPGETGKAHSRATPLRIRPFWRSGKRWIRHHIPIDSGMLIHVGTTEEALPGMRTWSVPAPVGAAATIFPPRNTLAGCEEWTRSNQSPSSGFILPGYGRVVSVEHPQRIGFACMLDFAAPFGLEVRPLIPAEGPLFERVTAVSVLVAGPAIAGVLAVLLSSRQLVRLVWLHLGRHALLGTFLAFVLTWRTLWAHRIDMLRDYEAFGDLMGMNAVLIWLVAASLAGNVVIDVAGLAAGSLTRRWRPAVLGFTTWLVLVIAGLLFAGLRGETSSGALQVVFSGVLVVGGPLWRAAIVCLRGNPPALWKPLRHRTEVWWSKLWSHTPLLLTIASAALLLVLNLLDFPILPLRLLGVMAAGPLLYGVVSRGLEGREGESTRNLAAFFTWISFSAALAFSDFGLTCVVVGPGATLAVALAWWEYASAARDPRLRRAAVPWFPLVAVSVPAALVYAASRGLDGASEFPRQFTIHVLHGGTALLIVLLATILFQARRKLPALLLVAVVLGWAFAFRAGPALLDEILKLNKPFSHRIGVVMAPSYTLLYGPRTFAASLAGWREAAAGGGSFPGYFGAQIQDAGTQLSIENDYLPVLILRELGPYQLAAMAGATLVLVAAGIVAARLLSGTRAGRTARWILLGTLAALCVYQPLGALGILPLTGVPWPLLGIDSLSDFWLWYGALALVFLWGDESAREQHEGDLTFGPAWKLGVGLGAVATVTGVALVLLGARFAAEREPLLENGRLAAVFGEDLDHVVRFVKQIHCARPALSGSTDAPHLAEPILDFPFDDDHLKAFRTAWHTTWQRERSEAVDAIRSLWAAGPEACTESLLDDSDHWRVVPRDEHESACEFVFQYGWPEVHLFVPKEAPEADASEGTYCEASEDAGRVAFLGYKPRRPYRDARIRLVSRAIGDAALDTGELIAQDLVVRLRPGRPPLRIGRDHAGILSTSRALLGRVQIEVEGRAAVVSLERGKEPQGTSTARLLIAAPPPSPLLRIIDETVGRWQSIVLEPGHRLRLDRPAVLIPSDATDRTWVFRPPSPHAGEPAAVDPLLADDLSTFRGAERRRYIYGSATPEIGWRTRSGGIGLDAWVRASLSALSDEGGLREGGPELVPHWSHNGRDEQEAFDDFVASFCGTRRPRLGLGFAQVCREDPYDGVLDCRLSVQPELQASLSTVLELTSLTPVQRRKGPSTLSWQSSYALLRGDTGEILAHGEFVPGRESSSLAPRRSTVERYLTEALDSHDETGTVKGEWGYPVPLGSTLKPLTAKSAELAAPELYEALRLVPGDGGGRARRCPPGRATWSALFGHCSPTSSIWLPSGGNGAADPSAFLSKSYNWFQAGLGFLGPALPDGNISLAGETPRPIADVIRAGSIRLSQERQITVLHGRAAVFQDGSLDVEALRSTPMWRNLEEILGRELCTGPSKAACMKRHEWGDLCAARALPIENPRSFLRRYVAIGHGSFDFLDVDGQGDAIKEYFQFLRGSGKHAIASTLQLAEAFSRVVYGTRRPEGGYELAASWLPTDPVGITPAVCRAEEPKGTPPSKRVSRGLCDVLRKGGTGAALAQYLGREDIVFYGAKTGTINSLAVFRNQIARESCHRANLNRTVPGLPAEQQPFHIDCHRRGRALDDKLFVVAFGVLNHANRSITPLTLAIRYQHAPELRAPAIAWDYISVIADQLDAR